jgi:hypothetical protein
MSKKSTNTAAPIPSGDPPSDPSRLDLLENKLDRVLNAISTLSTRKLDAHISPRMTFRNFLQHLPATSDPLSPEWTILSRIRKHNSKT